MLRPLSRSLLMLSLFACAGREGAAATRAAAAAAVTPAAATTAPATVTTQADSALAKADGGRILGNEKAAVWMIMVSDFQCPFCKRWHDETWATIRKDYVDSGKIRVAYVNLPLSMHRNAWPAAQAAMCASAQGKFWPMQDGLFASQKEWEKEADPNPKFEAIAAGAGIDVAALHRCVQQSVMRPLIEADVERATKAGASSTPTFFIDGRALLGAQPLAVFREALDAAIAAKSAGK